MTTAIQHYNIWSISGIPEVPTRPWPFPSQKQRPCIPGLRGCPVKRAAHTPQRGWSLPPEQGMWQRLPWKQLLGSCCCVCFWLPWQRFPGSSPARCHSPSSELSSLNAPPPIHPNNILATCHYISLVVGIPKHSLSNTSHTLV